MLELTKLSKYQQIKSRNLNVNKEETQPKQPTNN